MTLKLAEAVAVDEEGASGLGAFATLLDILNQSFSQP